jgi:hypothetical protein
MKSQNPQAFQQVFLWNVDKLWARAFVSPVSRMIWGV